MMKKHVLGLERLGERIVLTTLFFDSFENGLSSQWTIPPLDDDSRVAIRNLPAEGLIDTAPSTQFSGSGNEHSLVFDSRNAFDGDRDLSVAILAIDLQGQTSVRMEFHQLEDDDENQSLPDQPHALETAGDGVSISNDGIDWYLLKDIRGDDINRSGDGFWKLSEYDLSAEIARINTATGANLEFSANTFIKFSQYDESSFGTDGWAIDHLKISTEAEVYSPDNPSGAFHTYSVPNEEFSDFHYRIAKFGNVDSNTPILVSVHGVTRSIFSHTHRWSRAVDSLGVDDLVVIAPMFVDNAKFDAYQHLSWRDDVAADLALLDLVAHIASFGIGDPSRFYLFGFSGGGQFTQRFGMAHPDRLLASVVASPGTHSQPLPEVVFPYGVGPSSLAQPSANTEIDEQAYLSSRTMFWVGQDDNDPNHSQLDNSGQAKRQGESRLHRTLSTYGLMQQRASQLGIPPTTYQFEHVVHEGVAHSFDQSDFETWYEFLTAPQPQTPPVTIHPRVVKTASTNAKAEYLPQPAETVQTGSTFELEIWIESPDRVTGIQSGNMEVYFDTDVVDVIQVSPGPNYQSGSSFEIDEEAGRIRNIGGESVSSSVEPERYVLFARAEFLVTGEQDRQVAMAIQPGSGFVGFNNIPPRTDIRTVELVIASESSGTGTVQGTVFRDDDENGNRNSQETGVPGVDVSLVSQNGAVRTAAALEPDDFDHGVSLNKASSSMTLTAIGPAAVGPQVTARDRSYSPTGTLAFAGMDAIGWNGAWGQDNLTLRIDFHQPTERVSIDAGGFGMILDAGVMRAFDAQGNAVDTYSTQLLSQGQTETMTVASSSAEISYVLATGSTNRVRLDNLVAIMEPAVVTDPNGGYRIPQVPAGEYLVSVDPPSGWSYTQPVNGQQQVTVDAGNVAADTSFGIRLNPDFNQDGQLDCDDVDALVFDIAFNNNTLSFDLNGDGKVSNDDLDLWLAQAGSANLGTGQTYQSGDANLDGVVDVSDFNLWNGSKFTNTAAWCSGDFNADGAVDVSDFNLWNNNKFQLPENAVTIANTGPAKTCCEIKTQFVDTNGESGDYVLQQQLTTRSMQSQEIPTRRTVIAKTTPDPHLADEIFQIAWFHLWDEIR